MSREADWHTGGYQRIVAVERCGGEPGVRFHDIVYMTLQQILAAMGASLKDLMETAEVQPR